MLKYITIIGSGAIGALWAYYLQQAGFIVTVVGRQCHNNPIELTVILPNQQQKKITLNYLNQQLPSHSDLVIVATKAYQVSAAISPWLTQLIQTPIMLMHNGMGCVEQLPLNKIQPILLATTSHGGLKTSISGLSHTGVGQTFIGVYQGMAQEQGQLICQALNRALPQVAFSASIAKTLWTKLAINCAINPLTALAQCRNGELIGHQHQQVINDVHQEVILVATALNIGLDDKILRENINDVIHKTANNYSSMHQDIVNKRLTEIDFITGYLIKQAEKLAIAVPTNQRLYQQIKQLETKIPSQ